MRRFILLALALALCLAAVPAAAQTIIFIPADDRPVSFDYVVDTATAAGLEIITPPPDMLGNRTEPGDPDRLWAWLLDHSRTADAVVASADTLLYGSLVASRTHHLPADAIDERLRNFAKIKAINPATRLYVFATIMRTPQFSAGGVEPDYYETYGASIFRITALRDKAEISGLSRTEEAELHLLLTKVPETVLADWYVRREKNFSANLRLIALSRDSTFNYFLLGRDDCSPLSQSHLEGRLLGKAAAGLPASIYASFPGADQLGMLMVTRAANNNAFRIPLVRVVYAPGAGPKTIPSYEDVTVGQTIKDHIIAAGGLLLDAAKPELVLAVNTPEDGVTYEAGGLANRIGPGAATYNFADNLARDIRVGLKVTLADIAFANGADNALMTELAHRGLLFKLDAYSGWNTASNTLGFAIGQGMLARDMAPAAKNRLLAVRLLDDWAYQANIRGALAETVLVPVHGDYFSLDDHTLILTTEADARLRSFAAANIPALSLRNLKVSFPWNRMFELKIEL